jgi:hypothetical protein
MPDTNTMEFLVLSRGKWDESLAPEVIQTAIDEFYVWYERLLAEGKIKPGQRLMPETKLVSRRGIVDGPFAETKEVVGGYWFIVAASHDEAAQRMTENPCLACGLTLEIRQIELRRGSAFDVTCETPTPVQK